MLVEKEQTTFEPYVPERYSKSKDCNIKTTRYKDLSVENLKHYSVLCKNCKQPKGYHIGERCQTTYILQ